MSYEVYFSEDAEQDLLNIHTYIERQFSITLANEIYLAIREQILLLEAHPHLGTVLPELAALGLTEFRHMVVMNKNKIVYELDDKNERVFVYLICNVRQDYDAILEARFFR